MLLVPSLILLPSVVSFYRFHGLPRRLDIRRRHARNQSDDGGDTAFRMLAQPLPPARAGIREHLEHHPGLTELSRQDQRRRGGEIRAVRGRAAD
jgi:hypothetical protein